MLIKTLKLRSFLLLLFAISLLTNFIFSQNQEEYENSIGMKFKTISPGSFYMGYCRLSEKQKVFLEKFSIQNCPSIKAYEFFKKTGNPVRETQTQQQDLVNITKPFQIGVYEVTVEEFMKFAVEGGRIDLVSDKFIFYNDYSNKSPVTWVSWNDTQDFIMWLNEKEGGDFYRLPTEAEWEYAARAGSTSPFSWGDKVSDADEYAWFANNTYYLGTPYPQEVGQKKPNNFGLYDMHGNVWEWVQNWFGNDNYYNRNPQNNDPKGPDVGLLRVLRGGSWISPEIQLMTAARSATYPNTRSSGIGFRLVRMLEPDNANPPPTN